MFHQQVVSNEEGNIIDYVIEFQSPKNPFCNCGPRDLMVSHSFRLGDVMKDAREIQNVPSRESPEHLTKTGRLAGQRFGGFYDAQGMFVGRIVVVLIMLEERHHGLPFGDPAFENAQVGEHVQAPADTFRLIEERTKQAGFISR